MLGHSLSFFKKKKKEKKKNSRSRSIHWNMSSKTRCELKTKERTKPQFWKYPYSHVLTPQYIWIKIWLQVFYKYRPTELYRQRSLLFCFFAHPSVHKRETRVTPIIHPKIPPWELRCLFTHIEIRGAFPLTCFVEIIFK